MSDFFINKLLYGFWQNTKECKKLKQEQKNINSGMYGDDIVEIRKLLIKWNQKYQTIYNEFISNSKTRILLESNENVEIKKILKNSIKIIKNKSITKNVDDKNLLNTINKPIKNKSNLVVKKNQNETLSINSSLIGENQVNEVSIKNNENELEKIIDNSEIKKIEFILKNDEVPIIKMAENSQQSDDFLKDENISASVFSEYIDVELTRSLKEYKKSLKRYDKEFKTKKKKLRDLNKKSVYVNNKTPNFTKKISKLKEQGISDLNIIVNDSDEVFIHKTKNFVIIELQEEIKHTTKILNDNDFKNIDNMNKLNDQTNLPIIKVVRTKSKN